MSHILLLSFGGVKTPLILLFDLPSNDVIFTGVMPSNENQENSTNCRRAKGKARVFKKFV